MKKHTDNIGKTFDEPQATSMDAKPPYQPPVIMPLGELARGQGQCNPGSSHTGCNPGGSAGALCNAGTSPGAVCRAGGNPQGACNPGGTK